MRRFLISIFLFLCVVVITGIIVAPRFIIINKISCTFQNKTCSREVQDLIKSYKSQSLFSVKTDIANRFKNNVNIIDYNIEYKIPDALSVHVVERHPTYSLSWGEPKKFLLIDSEGYVLSISEKSDWPNLNIEGNLPKIGAKIDDTVLFPLQLLRDVNLVYQVKGGKLTEEGLVIELPSALRVIFPVDGDREVLMGSLILVTNEIKNDKNKEISSVRADINTIDLRYKNPILKNE